MTIDSFFHILLVLSNEIYRSCYSITIMGGINEVDLTLLISFSLIENIVDNHSIDVMKHGFFIVLFTQRLLLVHANC